MNSLYRLEHRKIGKSSLISVICNRGGIEVQSSEKIIPPILEFDDQGNYIVLGAKQVLQGIVSHPYKSNSKDFNAERLADLEIASLYKQLEHFPTLPLDYSLDTPVVHPIAEIIYSSLIYLKPNPELEAKLNSQGYIYKTKELPKILDKLAAKVYKDKNIKLDLHSVPKRKVGTYAYIADEDGIAQAAKPFSFGFHNIIPCDRIARELSSLKSCERFINPVAVPNISSEIAPFVSSIRVAIVGTKFSMLDSGDLFPSAIPKLSCKLIRKKVVKDIRTVPKTDRNLVFKPFRSGIEVHHEENQVIDEEKLVPGTIRLIFPGGVKIAAQYSNDQLKDSNGEAVDALLSFETFSKKGALACFLFNLDIDRESIDYEKAIELFKSLEKQKVFLNEQEYEGYVIDLPVMRPGQRYTELSKASNSITVDLIAKAILKKKYKVKPSAEQEYKQLIQLRRVLEKEIRVPTYENASR